MSIKVIAANDPRVSNRDKSMISAALRLAEQSDANQRHGAIVYRSGRVLGTGTNYMRNIPDYQIPYEDISVHAEIAAAKRVSPEALRGATVYIARRGKCDVHAMSHPCPSCYEALKKMGVKRIVYSVCEDEREYQTKYENLFNNIAA